MNYQLPQFQLLIIRKSPTNIASCLAALRWAENYGPVVVATRDDLNIDALAGCKIAVPGEHTTSWMLFQIFGPSDVTPLFVDFDEVESLVKSGMADAGILLHEGQILFQGRGFYSVLDLGKTWFNETGLPIPLGLDVVNRSLGEELGWQIATALKSSIELAQSEEDEALDYALKFGRGIGREDGRRFVRMYVNEDTLNMGHDGVAALTALFGKAVDEGILDEVPPLDILHV